MFYYICNLLVGSLTNAHINMTAKIATVILTYFFLADLSTLFDIWMIWLAKERKGSCSKEKKAVKRGSAAGGSSLAARCI